MSEGPIAISRLDKHETSREPQNSRAVDWLLEQHGGQIVVITPTKHFSSEILKRLIARREVVHRTWRGLIAGSFDGQRVLYAWPDRKHMNDVWGAGADALVVVEWNKQETSEWVAEKGPIQLLAEGTADPIETTGEPAPEPLPKDVDDFLEYVAEMAAGYSTGLKWNEEHKLKADMMNRPERWAAVTAEQVRARCRQLGMSPNDADTVSNFVQRRKDGHRFNVRSSYRAYRFN